MKQLSKHKKQVAILYVSTLVGTVLGVLASIVNTRFLNPADYGDVRYVQNIINFAASLLLFGYFLSGSRLLALSKNKHRSSRIRGAMVVILGIASIILLVITAISAFFKYNRPEVGWLFIVSLPVCFQPLFLNYINTTAQGDNHIGRLSIARLLPAFIYVPIGYYVFSNYGATSSRLIIYQWGIYTLIYLAVIVSTKPIFTNLKPIFKELNKENRTYGLQLYWGSLFMVASGYLAGIFLGIFNKDNTNVGFYTLAMTVTAPLAMLPAIVGTTYFKKFANESQIPKKVLKFTIVLTVISCLLFILLIKPLVSFLYSMHYAPVGAYASWLAIGFSIHGLGDMMNRYLGSHGQGKQIRNASIACGIFKIFGFSFLVWLWDIKGALTTVVISDVIYTCLMYFYYLNFVKYKNNEI